MLNFRFLNGLKCQIFQSVFNTNISNELQLTGNSTLHVSVLNHPDYKYEGKQNAMTALQIIVSQSLQVSVGDIKILHQVDNLGYIPHLINFFSIKS